MNIRHATPADLEALTALEAACFPPAEAADRDAFRRRLAVYPGCFWLLEEDSVLIAAVNGLATDEPHLRDEMFADTRLHNPKGAWQMIFGVETHPAFQHRGYQKALMSQVIDDVRRAGRLGLVLTCKEALLPFYEQFGFQNEGVSPSQHGGALWYEMRLPLKGTKKEGS